MLNHLGRLGRVILVISKHSDKRFDACLGSNLLVVMIVGEFYLTCYLSIKNYELRLDMG